MSDDPEITDPRDPYKRPDIVTELDRQLLHWHEPMLRRARDEIVALRASLERHDRLVINAVVVATPAIRDAALEEAAQRCARLATDYTIPIDADNWSAGCRGCAGRIRALKKDEAALTVRSALLRRLRRCNPGAEGQGMRASGYYWVLFNWPLFDPTRAPEWQPASWDDVTSTWVVIGSRQEIPFDEPCIIEVDERGIERATSHD